MYVTIVPEGQLEEDALRRLVAYSCPKTEIFDSLLKRKIPNRETEAAGRDSLEKNIHRYRNAAAKAGQAYVILFDLEQDYPCAPDLLTKWELAGEMPDNFIVNIAVRSTESWLMADREGIAQFLSISIDRVPLRPDEIDRPKQMLMNLGQKSQSSKTRNAFAPVSGESIGPGYNSYICAITSKTIGALTTPRTSPPASPAPWSVCANLTARLKMSRTHEQRQNTSAHRTGRQRRAPLHRMERRNHRARLAGAARRPLEKRRAANPPRPR